MTILIFFALALVTIVVAIFLNRLVRCPILVGFLFFSITLLIAVILSNTTLIVIAIVLGILAFLAALIDCIIKSSCFFRNNRCLTCHNPYGTSNTNNNNNNNCDNTLRIINNNGEVIARINGDSINCIDNDDGCGCGCGNNSTCNNDNFLNTTANGNNILSTNSNSDCGCNRRYYRSIR